MIILIAGASHTGKTVLAQTILEKHSIPYLSIDHLKMGLIRSGHTHLTPQDDKELVPYLWPIVREIIKTAIENQQNLVIEGAYIPFDWKSSFDSQYLKEIRYCCLIMSNTYIENHFTDIKQYANVVEHRLDDTACTPESLMEENADALRLCQKYKNNYVLIERNYCPELILRNMHLHDGESDEYYN